LFTLPEARDEPGTMQEFEHHTLAEFDGSRDDGQVYIARDGKVFDVSASKLWKTGMHMNRHKAGRDLTADFSAAPHGEEVFERVPQVGVLVEEKDASLNHLPRWVELFLGRNVFFRRHPHPMIVHFPIVFMFSTTCFILLALVTGNRTFETTALHCLGAGLIFTPLAMATGFMTWWFNYGARLIRPVKIKIWSSILLLLDAGAVFAWRLLEPGILSKGGFDFALYMVLVCGLVPLVSIVGWFGAQLTFPLE
jgi:predicted heme/steroid binding protein/uncharacterized membrane protein